MALFLYHYIVHSHSEIIKQHQTVISDPKLAFCHENCAVCYSVDVQR